MTSIYAIDMVHILQGQLRCQEIPAHVFRDWPAAPGVCNVVGHDTLEGRRVYDGYTE